MSVVRGAVLVLIGLVAAGCGGGAATDAADIDAGAIDAGIVAIAEDLIEPGGVAGSVNGPARCCQMMGWPT